MATDTEQEKDQLPSVPFELSDETLRFIDLWYDDGSWALEELGGHEKTIIGEILKAAGILSGRGAARWHEEDENENRVLEYQCKCGHR